MNAPLPPTAEELAKLPMRAVVAYAGRNARRLSRELRGVVAEDILDDLLGLVDSVSTASVVSELEQTPLAIAAQRLTDSYAAASDEMKSLRKFHMVFSLVNATLAAIRVIEAVVRPQGASRPMKSAAKRAHRTVWRLDALKESAARAARQAARQDYEILLSVYGEHDEVILGDPVDCFETEEEAR